MTNEQKKQVRDALVRYANKFDTQTMAAETLDGVSISTLSQVKNGKWEMISDRLWQNIARQVGFYCGEWQPADTTAYLLLRILFSDAQHYAMTYGIAIGNGLGKTFAAGRYAHEHGNTYYLAGNEEYNKKTFATALLNTAGIATRGNVAEMIQLFADYIAGQEDALLIFDDMHRLKDRVLHLVVLLANKLAGGAGIIMMGGEKLQESITEGVRVKKAGFDDVYNNIGKRFITLGAPGPKDVELLCRANGVSDEQVIHEIKEESKSNLHTATRLIIKHTQLDIAA
jgi:hypothetical protein